MKKYKTKELKEILDLHKIYKESSGLQGKIADLSEADLHNVNLSCCDLFDANLTRSNLAGADLSMANLSNANLFSSCLADANLSSSNLSNANLCNANLSNANLYNANLSNVDLSYTYLSNANLYNANLSNAHLYKAYLNKICLSNTKINCFVLGKDTGYAWVRDNKLFIKIGCEEHVVDYWKKNGKQIANRSTYSKKEIKIYEKMIDLLILNNKE